MIQVDIGDDVYDLYVAQSRIQKEKGLSGIDSFKNNVGMIFPYSDEKPRTFQFRDTLLPLAVYFISGDGRVVQKSYAGSGQRNSIHCPHDCKWVIEVEDK